MKSRKGHGEKPALASMIDCPLLLVFENCPAIPNPPPCEVNVRQPCTAWTNPSRPPVSRHHTAQQEAHWVTVSQHRVPILSSTRFSGGLYNFLVFYWTIGREPDRFDR